MTVEISSKIVGIKIKKAGDDVQLAMPPAPVVPDVDPLHERIPSRPDGMLEAVSEKITYFNYEGKKNVYILVSFLPVEGVLNGERITIERPIEFFLPMGQLSSEHQWITATMRNLSLAARGGYVTQALTDLRKVSWDKGPVRCGLNQWDKPQYHDSEVAAIAWSIQQILYKRGFLDLDGNQVPTPYLARAYTKRHLGLSHASPDDDNQDIDANQAPAIATFLEPASIGKSVGECPTCNSNLYLMDGCPTCHTCGFSKCQ